jgi:hypothetical protein
MFGLNDNTNSNYNDTAQMSASDASSLNTGTSLDSAPPAALSNAPISATPPPAAPAAMPPLSSTPQPATPNVAKTSPAGINDVSLDNAYIDSGQVVPQAGGKTDSAKPSAASLVNGGHEDELLKLKQQALQSLAPLVDHLDQDPEEKFKTTMMMIQASDNADLIPEAYEAASKITDEKLRAQALLDVVNEINYFTQHPAETQQ